MKEDQKPVKKVAASGMPTNGQTPSIPPVPLKAYTVNPAAPIIHRNMAGAVLTIDEPAQGSLAAVTTRWWGELAMELGLGTSRPPKARIGLDESKTFLYLTPVKKEDPTGVKVTYRDGRALINLIQAFAPLQRYVQPDRREFYDVKMTHDKVVFDDGYESISLYVYLVPTKEEPRRRMSEESKAKARETRTRKKNQRLNGGGATNS